LPVGSLPRIPRAGKLLIAMADIVLTTLNAKYIHAAFGLRYLLANLGPLRAAASIVEFDINQRPVDIAEALLARNPKIVGLGIYIWNVAPAAEVVATLKRIRPVITVILGGPEVSYETDPQPIVQLADYIITGEADLAFPKSAGNCSLANARRPRSYPRGCRSSPNLRCPMIYMTTRTLRTASYMWKPRAAVPSRASFAFPRSTSPCGRRRCPLYSVNCSACSTGACGSSSSWIGPSI